MVRVFDLYELITPTVLTARVASTRVPVYAYRFSRVSPRARSQWGGATHSVELPYVFDPLVTGASQFEARDSALSAEIADGLGTFCQDRQASMDMPARWPLFAMPAYQHLEFGDVTAVQASDWSDVDFFRSIFASRPSEFT